MAAQTTTALSMKLFIDTSSRRVLFAEAGKDVVDFLFSLLDLPLGTAVCLVGGTAFVAGSAGNLYHKAKLEARRLHHARPPVAAMDTTVSSFSPAASLFFMPASSFDPSRIFFRCKNNYAGHGNLGVSIQHCCLYMILDDVGAVKDLLQGTACPNCGNPMTDTLYYVSPVWSGLSTLAARKAQSGGSGGGGSAVQDQEAATYTVLDNLDITQNHPTSPISTVTRLGRLGITDLGVIQERTVRIRYYRGLKILEALMDSKTVLTDAFLGKVRA